jgi:hypothetical protein
MKPKRSLLKRYITIQLDESELAKRAKVKNDNKLKHGNKLSDRKIYMAMIDTLSQVVNDVLDTPSIPPPDNIMVDETVIPEEE